MWETLLWLLVGAVIAFFPTWILSNISHKWELEGNKRERAIAAREVRLKEGEEKIKEFTSEFYYLVKMANQLINVKSDKEEAQSLRETQAEAVKINEEIDKGKILNQLSVKSLADEQLNKAWEKVENSINAYRNFNINLAEYFIKYGKIPIPEHDKYVKNELVLKQSYFSSVEEFLRRINELRSQ